MKIKLALLEKDESYLNRIVSAFNAKYADKFEIYSFTDLDVAISTVDSARIDVLISSDCFEIDLADLPQKCGFAYFVNSSDIETINEQRAICKFQKAELIYKQILSVYSENAGSVSGLKIGDEATKFFAFISASGGTGSSTMAAACATHFAQNGKKTLYLNLEKFGSADSFFSAEGQFDMSDIIFALKTKKTNLTMKLESCVKQDSNGVCYYSQSKIALDMLELSVNEIIRLISEIRFIGSYEYVILDIDFGMDEGTLNIFRQMHSIVMVGDGSEISNVKTARALQALAIREQNEDSPLNNRIVMLYNKFSNKISKTIEIEGLKNIGGAPRYEHATIEQIISQLSSQDMFDKID